MASFTAGTTFVDGVSNDVTAAKLGALVNNATPTSGLIQDRTAETITATNDTLLIGDASDSNNLKRITVANFAQTLPTAKVTTGTIDTGTFGTTTSTAATITTGTIPTLTSITKITSGTGTAAAPAISPTGDTNTGIFFPAADTVAFAEGGVEAMRITSDANVGIGVTPTSKLQIGTGGQLQFDRPDGANQFRLGYTSNDLKFRLNFNNGSDLSVVDSSGNVGIGTTSPNAKLDVSGSFNATSGTIPTLVATTLITTGTGTAAAPAIVPTGDTNTGIFFPAADTIAFSEGGAEAMRINSSGQVGIGVTPTVTLDVDGELKLRANGAEGGQLTFLNTGNASTGLVIDVSTADIGRIFSANDNSVLQIGQLVGTGGRINFYTAGTERLRIDGNGNVGIGTTAQVNKLEVVGSFGRGAPVTKTTDFTLADTENWLIVNKGSSCTVTLPAASSWTGREFTIKVITAHAVVSASSNIIPRIGGAAATAILPATDGAWATLVSNGTNWEIMCGS